MSANPYIGGAETPKLPNLVGGAEAYGLLSVSRAELLSSDFEDNVPDDAIAALIRLDAPPSNLTADFPGYDMLMLVNLVNGSLDSPKLLSGSGDPVALMQGGLANELLAGGPQLLNTLNAGEIFVTLVPESANAFSASVSINVWNFSASVSDLADGEVAFLTIATASQPRLAIADGAGSEASLRSTPTTPASMC